MSQRNQLILLFVSLALNLFIVGAVAGAWLLGGHLPGRGGGGPRGGPPMFAAASVLPDNEADAYRDVLGAEAQAVRPRLREARTVRHDAWLKLAADPVDTAGIVADLDRARSVQAQAQSEMDRKVVEFAARLPAAERARFGQALSEPPQRGGGHRRRGPPPDQP